MFQKEVLQQDVLFVAWHETVMNNKKGQQVVLLFMFVTDTMPGKTCQEFESW
jgi:hypothetical protein